MASLVLRASLMGATHSLITKFCHLKELANALLDHQMAERAYNDNNARRFGGQKGQDGFRSS